MLSGLLVLTLFAVLGSTALASGTWYVDGVNGNDANDCKTPQTACKTIGHAISLASLGDTVMVAAATYSENLTIPFSLTIKGAGPNVTIIDGGKVKRAVTIPRASSTVRIAQVTIQNGSTSGYGGGIYNAGRLGLKGVVIAANNSNGTGQGGGGIYNRGTLAVIDSIVENNHAHNNGGIASDIGATLIVANSTVSGNTADNFGGGIGNNGKMTIANSTLSGNGANIDGGGIWNNGGTLTITNSTLSGNHASVVTSSGDILNIVGTVMIDDSTISQNSAGEDGGIGNNGTMSITNSTISENTANIEGGGIDNGGTLTISNSTISGNSVAFYGGGIFNGHTLTISNSTLSGNTAGGDGGGIVNEDGATTSLQNTIVANSPSGGNCAGSVKSNGYNLSSDGTCQFNGPGDLNNTDPKLGPLQNNGGPTWTQALLDGSPAIDAGNPGGCTDGNGKLLTTDQRGYPRPDPEDPTGCDMGAYERQGD